MDPLTLEQIRAVCPSSPAWVVDPLNQALTVADVTTPQRAAMFLAQLAQESQELTRFEENLNYSAAALVATWPLHFTADLAAQLARQPARIANHVYADRLGNGDEDSGDGWKYRGRGAIQLTGFINYLACGMFLQLDLLGHPELAALPAYVFQVAAWFWRVNGLNAFADAGDVAGATKRINGGLTGLSARLSYFARARAALGLS